MPIQKIDFHSHYFPPAYLAALERHGVTLLDGAPKPAWSEESQLEFMRELDIERCVLTISSPHFNFGDAAEASITARACNEYGAELMRKYPDKLTVFGSLPIPEVNAAINEIIYCRKALGIRGFALPTHVLGCYLGSDMLEPVMAELNKEPTIAVLHPYGLRPGQYADVNKGLPDAVLEYFCDTTRTVTQMLLKGTVRKYPNIRFVIPHAGAFLPILSDRLATLAGALGIAPGLDVFGDLAKFYYDLAGVSMPKQYDILREMTDESHLLYGSDAPFTPLPLCRKFAQAMDEKLGGAKQNIYHDNAVKLLSYINE